jgi:predicted nucleotidyltransferase/N-acetylglutamate synthase-like GNAT family acetyltransferase
MRFINLLRSIYAIIIITLPVAYISNGHYGMNNCINVRIAQVSDDQELAAARRFRQVYFFGPAGIQDPYEEAFADVHHLHFVLYQETAIVGYCHAQIWSEKCIMIRIMAIDEHMRNQGLGQCFMRLLEDWLACHGYSTIYLDSRPTAVNFYEKCGFRRAAFNDPEGSRPHPQDIQMQKQIKNNNTQSQQQLQDCIALLKVILGSDLLGVYLYGSSLVGGLQKYSDIDLFVVTHRATTTEEKKQLISCLLQVSGVYLKDTKFPLEITIAEKSAINPWHYPPHCDFQYGEWLRTSFENGITNPCTTHEVPDLALIVTQVLLKSKALYGPAPEQLLAQVPYHDFMQAMLHDVNRLTADLEHDTRNVLLTYARIWSTLATDEIRSKSAAADWVIQHLPHIYQPVMQRAKAICTGKEDEHWDDINEHIKPCADFMVDQINAQAALLHFNDPNKSIKLTEEPHEYHIS